MKNSVLLRRKNKVILEKGISTLPLEYISSANKNLESYGYIFSEKLLDVLVTLNKEEFVSFYKDLIKDIKILKGAHVEHKPMYVNFPDEVMEADESILYFNALKHYLSSFIYDAYGVRVLNDGIDKQIKKERFPLIGDFNLQEISLGTEEDLKTILVNLVSSKTSISVTDKDDLTFLLNYFDNVVDILPSEIPFKENMIFVISSLLENKKVNTSFLSKYLKTSTDILRLCTSLSGGDISLASNTKFKSFKRSERRFILSSLENIKNIEEDMVRHKNKWKRLGEKLHPGDFAKKYPNTYKTFTDLRENEKIETFNSKVEKLLLDRNILELCDLLSTRPGDFARRLDHILRITKHENIVIDFFEKVVDKITTPVLLQLRTHFSKRDSNNDIRIFIPKGDVCKVVSIKDDLVTIDEEYCLRIYDLITKELINRFSTLSPLGNVKIDKNLSNFLVPFSQRSASKSLKTISRGSSFEIPEGDVIRLFVYWKEKETLENDHYSSNRVDLDLSSVFYDENWKLVSHVSYTNLRNSFSVHSGDITSAPNGASEFIDINIEKAKEKGVRYVISNLYNFTDSLFSDLPEAFSGWMIRKDHSSGEIFDPLTVQDKFDLTAKTSISIPFIFDLVENKVVWCDLGLKHNLSDAINIQSNESSVSLVSKAMLNINKPNLYELFELHAIARGNLLSDDLIETDEVEINTIFSLSEGIKPTDTDVIVSEFI